jgi:hypothetical protein
MLWIAPLMKGTMGQADYDTAIKELSKWADQQIGRSDK